MLRKLFALHHVCGNGIWRLRKFHKNVLERNVQVKLNSIIALLIKSLNYGQRLSISAETAENHKTNVNYGLMQTTLPSSRISFPWPNKKHTLCRRPATVLSLKIWGYAWHSMKGPKGQFRGLENVVCQIIAQNYANNFPNRWRSTDVASLSFVHKI